MKDVNKRFLDVYSYLLREKFVNNASDMANKIEISSSMMNEILKKRSNAGLKVIQKTVNKFSFINTEWLLVGNGEMLKTKNTENLNKKNVKEFVKENTEKRKVQKNLTFTETPTETESAGIPLIPIEAMAGWGTGEVQVMDYEMGLYKVPEFDNIKVDFMIRARGSSMYPKYNSGDTLACLKVELGVFFQWNKVYVLDTSQGAMVKRIKKSDKENHILCVSDNPNYDPFDLPLEDLYAIALVVGVIRLE